MSVGFAKATRWPIFKVSSTKLDLLRKSSPMLGLSDFLCLFGGATELLFHQSV
jgi:hypothetical protein